MKPLQAKLAQYTVPQEAKAAGIYPYFTPITSEQNTEVYVQGREGKILMFGSNSYLGLTNDPRLKEAAKRAIDKYGTGCAGSPFLNGTLDIHIQLQDELAEFLGKEGVMLFSAGFLANSGVIPDVVGRGETTTMELLKEAGFNPVVVEYRYSDTYDLGVVMWQSVTGSQPKGTTVELIVSNGPEPQPETTPETTPETDPSAETGDTSGETTTG